MSKNLNRCEFIGNMGKDPEQAFTPAGSSVVNFSLAVGDDYKDKQGQKVEQTEWVNFVAFGKSGEIIAQYCQKGSKLWCAGKFKTDKWTDKEGNTRYSTKIQVNDFEFIGGNQQGSTASSQRPSAIPQNAQPTQNAPVPDFDDFDDSIPF